MAGPVLVHLITPMGWDEARAAGEVRPPSLAADGFVHLCRPDQLTAVVGRHYADWPDALVLELDADRLDAEVRWVEPHPGEHYPHLHGPLPVHAVVAVHRWARDADGRWPPPPLSGS